MTLFVLVGLLIVLLLLADLGVTVGRLSPANVLVWFVVAAGSAVSLGTKGLFTATDPSLASAINLSAAALLWLAIIALMLVVARAGAALRNPAGGLETGQPGSRVAVVGHGRRRPATGGGGGPGKRRVPRASRILFLAVAVVTALETAGFAGTYFLYSRHYVYTDNAQVDGNKINVAAPASGTVTDWSIDQGSAVHTDQVVGRIRAVSNGPEWLVKAPETGTVAVSDVVNGTYVSAGTSLATAYDLAGLYVTARVNDYDVGQVHPGAAVDIRVDAFPNVAMTGVVSVVQDAAAGQFDIYPAPGTLDPSNPHRVNQYVPVRIAFTNTGGARVEPGMNVSVHIHKQ